MPQIGQSLGATIPAIGTAGTTYATNINDALTAIVDACEAGVSTSVGLTVDSDVDFDGNGIADASHLGLTNQASQPTTAGFAYIYNNEWYLNDGLGNDVRITLSGALDASSVGGIGGDYGGGNPAAVSFNDASSKYTFTTDPGVYATLEAGPVRHIASTSGNAVTVKAPDTLAGAYTAIWPPTIPGSGTQLLQITSTGAMSCTAAPSVTSLTASAAVSGGSVVTAEVDIRHAERTVYVPAAAGYPNFGIANWTLAGNSWSSTGANETIAFPIPIPVGSRLKSVSAYIKDNATAMTAKVFKYDPAGASPTGSQVGSTATSSATTAVQTLTVSGLTDTAEALESFYMQIEIGSTASGCSVRGISYVFDRVA